MTKRYSWTQPCCEDCWYERNNREPTRLVESVRDREICVYCDAITESGIYVRIDPNQAMYPSIVKR